MDIRSGSIKRIISLILSAALVVPSVLCFPAQSFASIESSDTEAVKMLSYSLYDTPDVTYYSDDMFRGNSVSKGYDISLSTMSYYVSNISYDLNQENVSEQSRKLQVFLEDNGFTDFEANQDYNREATTDSSAVACAHKKITDNGKEYTLLAVIPRSGTFGAEFENSLRLSNGAKDKGDHAGYSESKDKVIDFTRDYVERKKIKGDVKLWTTGLSGGACVDNLFAAELIRDPQRVLGNDVRFEPGDLYCYAFSPMRVASVYSDCKNKKYNSIHNVYDKADIISNIMTADEFDRYGKDYYFRDYADKYKMLSMLKTENEYLYYLYLTSADPDLYKAYKPDVNELLKNHTMVVLEDDDSYLPKNQADYLDTFSKNIAQICAQEGNGDSRRGFYKSFQEPMMHLIRYFFSNGFNYSGISVMLDAFTGTKTSMPLMLSMYMSFMVNKHMNDKSSEFNSIVESGFNRMASEMENEDGSVKEKYSRNIGYQELRDLLFVRSGSGEYKLRHSINRSERSLLLRSLKELSACLYAESFREALGKAGADQDTIDQLTSKEDSAAVSWFMANIMFGNSEQDHSIELLSLDNQQFCQAATLMGNKDRFITLHIFYNVISWFRAADPYYADYCRPDNAQIAGYRRVFIDQPEGVSVNGTVTDGSGKTVASFKDGKLLSRDDEWIGITTADNGNWLRLPLDRSYKVNINVSRDADLGIRIADYSVKDSEVKRTSDGDGKWDGFRVNAADTVILDVPEAKKTGDEYDPASAEYSLEIKSAPQDGDSTAVAASEVYTSSVPKAKSVKTKAGKKSFTVRWNKLSKKQRKKFGKVEVQYSTDPGFGSAQSVYAGKNKTSYKVKGLSRGSTYYVRVRNVKTGNGTIYVSKWSKPKKVTVK